MYRVKLFVLVCSLFCLVGCGNYNYAVNKADSKIPYANQYSDDDNEEHEFYSTLYKIESDRYRDLVYISHMSDVYIHKGTPDSTWRMSRLSFDLGSDSGVEIIPSSVKLEHLSIDGELFSPSKVEKTIEKCAGVIGCRGRVVLHYTKRLPEKIIENVSFNVIEHGKEKTLSYTLSLEYKRDYSFWDVLMGI